MKKIRTLILPMIVLLLFSACTPTSPSANNPPAPKPASINSFEECAAAGYAIMESFPPQCKTPDGRTFTQTTPPTTKPPTMTPAPNDPTPSRPTPPAKGLENCLNQCGDGTCQEIVCMGTNCPCAENPTSCPQDCSEQGTAPGSAQDLQPY